MDVVQPSALVVTFSAGTAEAHLDGAQPSGSSEMLVTAGMRSAPGTPGGKAGEGHPPKGQGLRFAEDTGSCPGYLSPCYRAVEWPAL